MPDLTALSTLREAATPKPWSISPASWNSGHRENTPLLRGDSDYSYIGALDSDHSPNAENAAYIVALVNVAPALIAELEAAREVVRIATVADETGEYELYREEMLTALANHKEATR